MEGEGGSETKIEKQIINCSGVIKYVRIERLNVTEISGTVF
jgi:hypothetical protein